MYIPQVQDLNIFVILVVTFLCLVTAYSFSMNFLNTLISVFVNLLDVAAVFSQHRPVGLGSVNCLELNWSLPNMMPASQSTDTFGEHLKTLSCSSQSNYCQVNEENLSRQDHLSLS